MLQPNRVRSDAAGGSRQSGHDAPSRAAVGGGGADAIHLAELISPVRARFALPAHISDAWILECLETIAAETNPRARWRAAFASPIAEMVSRRGADLNTEIGALLALLPKPAS